MSNITVWTKQHENVLKELETSGRYIAKQEYIRMDLKEQDPVVLAESIRTEVLNLSKAPGDFWVLQMAEDGYTVEKFVYREGDYTVWYTLEPKSYTVYYEDYMAGKEE